MLTGNKIMKELSKDNIVIDPFNIDQLNPNSYNISLSDEIAVYSTKSLIDPNNPDSLKTIKIKIPKTGFLLLPGELYLGSTKETIGSDKYISAIDGRSSIGRLGISIHSTAGFGDIGFKGQYTLEISVIKPVMIYPDMLIGQVYFTKPNGKIDFLYRGRYQNQIGATASKINEKNTNFKGYHYFDQNSKNEFVGYAQITDYRDETKYRYLPGGPFPIDE